MKPKDSISLNMTATLLVGVISAITILVLPVLTSSNSTSMYYFLALLPILLASGAAYFQYRYVLKPSNNVLSELAATAQNLSETQRTADTKGSQQNDHFSVLRSSIAMAAEQIKDAQQREKTLVQHAADVICVIDLKGKLLSVNPASKSVWGYRPDELLGKQITDFIVSEDINNTMKSLVGAEKSIDKIYFENRFLKKNGQTVDMLWSAHVSASERGLFCIAHDISERKRAEQLLRESEEKIRGILESLPAGVAVIGRNGQIEFLNQTASELLGRSSDFLSDLSTNLSRSPDSGGGAANAERVPKNLNAEGIFGFFKGVFATNVRNGQAVEESFESQIVKNTGERIPVEVSTRPIAWAGTDIACLVIFLDATMKHELEQSKREFVAMISHDLRTPLTSIHLIFASMLDGFCGDINEQGMLFAERGKQACDRLILLVQDLLDLEKMKAGKWVMDMVETPLLGVLSAAVDAVTPFAQAQEVQISVDCPEISCYCDGGRIIQVLVNLIGNAIKFSFPEGTVQIVVSEKDSFVTLSVLNLGRKITSDKLKSIFEKFEQADAHGAIERKGTGLGLAISKSIVEQHGGEIWVESTDEEGTRFSFTIPRYSPDGSAGNSTGAFDLPNAFDNFEDRNAEQENLVNIEASEKTKMV